MPAFANATSRRPRRLRLNRVGVDVDQRHPGLVSGQHLAVGEPEPAGAAGDDDAEPGHVEL